MCVECDLAEPESLASLGGSAPGVVDGILSITHTAITSYGYGTLCLKKGPNLPGPIFPTLHIFLYIILFN